MLPHGCGRGERETRIISTHSLHAIHHKLVLNFESPPRALQNFGLTTLVPRSSMTKPPLTWLPHCPAHVSYHAPRAEKMAGAAERKERNTKGKIERRNALVSERGKGARESRTTSRRYLARSRKPHTLSSRSRASYLLERGRFPSPWWLCCALLDRRASSEKGVW